MENLHQLTSRLSSVYLSSAVTNNNFFINDVPHELPIEHNKEYVASVISGLLSTVVDHARNTCIRLSAKIYGFVIVFEIREAGSINGYAMACGLQEVQAMAEKIGGHLSIGIQKPTTTTISFSFPNLPKLQAMEAAA